MQKYFLPLVFLMLFQHFACVAPKQAHELFLSQDTKIIFLDKVSAGKAITTDKIDKFFERVNLSEISIQMKKPLNTAWPEDKMRKEYVQYLKDDVDDFTEAEITRLKKIFDEIYFACGKFNRNIFPKELRLIKTRAHHYGESVYYTRENCIIIPYNELEGSDLREITKTMYHELFHVYSRLNPGKRTELYRCIGFEPIGYDNLILPKNIAQHILLNPDGVDIGQVITLKDEKKGKIKAIPVIFSLENGYKTDKPNFFDYVQFNLYEVESTVNNKYKVITKEDGLTSTLELQKCPDFFHQIKDNTNYIIHPDEILADNFSFLMRATLDTMVTKNFSAEGKQLLRQVRNVVEQ